MNTNILVTASTLSDQDLLARLEVLAGTEREALAELVAHLAALDSRPLLYAAQGYGSLFTYCTQALRLSEDAACNRIEAARACRRFPLILELMVSGSLSLTSVRVLGRHFTAENHESVLAKARHRTRREIEALVAELAPRPDVPSAVRKLPSPSKAPPPLRPRPVESSGPGLVQSSGLGQVESSGLGQVESSGLGVAMTGVPSLAGPSTAPSPATLPTTRRPIVQALSPERYRVQFTIGQETHEKLCRLQALLRREIPDGDPGAIFDRALTVLLEKVEKTKLAAATKPRPTGPIRSETDREIRKPGPPSRTVPREVKRAVWGRDAGQCAFASPTGRRCTERTFLEYHHVQAYAKHGPATVDNISLRCWRHNHYEAELIFGPHGPSIVREARPSSGPARFGPSKTIDS
jgi:hypothetical protein